MSKKPTDQLDLFVEAPANRSKPAKAPRSRLAPSIPPPADDEGRKAARSVFDSPVIVEAGAGTGKTAALIARVLAWCLGPGWQRSAAALPDATHEAIAARTVERVAAITFTERAAVEMERKVARGLRCLLQQEPVIGFPRREIPLDDDELVARAGALTTSLDRLNVGTIHAFCRRILAGNALEAGLDPAFEIDAEGDGVRAAVDEALGELLHDMYGDPGREEFIVLASRGYGPKEIAETVQQLAGESIPPEAFDQDPYAPQRVLAERDALQAELTPLLPVLQAAFGAVKRSSKATDTLGALEKLSHHLAATEDVDDLVDAVQEVDLLGCMKHLSFWKSGKFGVAEGNLLGEAQEQVQATAERLTDWLKSLQKIDPVVLRAACKAHHFLLGRVREILRVRGIQTYQDLLEDACKLLVEKPGVRLRARGSMDQLLVDEFQDTDPTQCEILRLLALDGEASERPGLFLVGDPKQSIYGWRSADLEAYEGFVRKACEAGGKRYFLTVNFRSAPPVLDEVHRLLEPLMVYEQGVQPEYRQLVPCRQKRNDPGHSDDVRRPVEHWISWDIPGEADPGRKSGFDTSVARAREIEADAIARDMADLSTQGVPWREMALLLRVSTVQDIYLRAFREHEIPFVVERDKTFYQHREVIDAASLLRAVVDPNDQVALVGFLRSPWVGVPDAAWLPLWGVEFPKKMGDLRGPDEDMLEALDKAIDEAVAVIPAEAPGLDAIEGWSSGLKSTLRTLATLRASFRNEPADLFVDKLKAMTFLEEVEAARFLGIHRLANLDRFFRGVLEALVVGEGGPQMVLRALREGVAGERGEEVGPPGDETLDAVRVLTIHVAKGLEFDHVYAADLHHKLEGGSFQEATEVRRHGKTWELNLLGARSLGYHRVEERANRVGAAEEIRTLYVAATRAARRLVLVGRWPDPGKDPAGPFPTRAQSFVEYLQHRGGKRPDLALHLGSVGQGGEESKTDATGVRWRIPRPLPPAERKRGKKPGAAITVEEARRDLKLLTALRTDAARRMERPLAAAASARAHELLREAEENGAGDSADVSPVGRSRLFAGGGQREAMAVGKAVHRALEELDLSLDPSVALKQQRDNATALVVPLVAPDEVPRVQEKVDGVLAGLEGLALLQRLAAVAPHILGREVPLFLAGEEDAGPVGVSIGSIDLLYRDPEDGSLVVADYKTDTFDGEHERETRVSAYAAQGSVYVDAVKRFAPEGTAVRFELWFLKSDQVVQVGP